jgi:hypothetical protein
MLIKVVKPKKLPIFALFAYRENMNNFLKTMIISAKNLRD